MVRLEINGIMTEPIKAMGDTGSQPNLVVQNVLSKYGFSGMPNRAALLGISGSPVHIRRKLEVKIFPWFESDEFVRATFWVLPRDSKWKNVLPDRAINPGEVKLPNKLHLADPMFWQPEQVKLLFGIEIWAQMIKPNVIPISKSLVQQDTKFGAVILGRTGTGPIQSSNSVHNIREYNYKELETLLKRMWEIEQVPNVPMKSREQELAEKIFREKRIRDESGRFHVPILLQPSINDIGDSRSIAAKRFSHLEKRFKREPSYHQQYVEFMREYIQLGHMIEATREPEGMSYYIPHHGITSSSSFKVVFDSSCKTDKGISLNEGQLKGSKLQRDLYDIILRARRFKYGISVDIKKMYRQIRIIPEHWDLQRIFWREKCTEPLKEYWLVTVIYGQTSSPINAIMTMHEGAESMKNEFPRAVEVIQQDFYMDDGFSGAETEEQIVQLSRELETVFATMQFPLDKWKSNSNELMRAVKGEDSSMLIEEHDQQSILGLKWNLKPDTFSYQTKSIDKNERWSRRTVLSKVASLYDPVGHLEPVLLTAKAFVQLLWKKTGSWDEELSNELKEKWLNYLTKIPSIEQVKIPRWIGSTSDTKIELHGFADASSLGSGVVIYVRTEDANGIVKVVQLTAKSKVAPLKLVSIPRLELVAATLLAKLMKHVRTTMEWENVPYYLWTDSMITLQWMSKEPCELKTFVGNRIAKIQECTNIQNWHHVSSKDNPADLVSRGLMPDEIAQNDFWWNGSPWLGKPKKYWPMKSSAEFDESEMKLELKINVIRQNIEPMTIRTADGELIPLLEFSNKLDKILLIYSYVLRFIRVIKNKQRAVIKKKTKPKLIFPPLEGEIGRALKDLIKYQQGIVYSKELRGQMNSSALESLHPIIDNEGMLRVGGRLKHASCPYELKVPIIIPPKSRLSNLIISDAHDKLNHGHVQVMMQYIRTRYWIPRLRLELRHFVSKCVVCKRYEHPLGTQLMGDLPMERTTPCKPFTYTGVDYAGPVLIREYLKTKTNVRKCWIAVFVCLNTRAIHLDVVTDASSYAYIQCFKRFIGRRGECITLFSDNGTNFVGASKELKAAFDKWNSADTHRKLSSFGTKWKFMTAGAPHQGGIYEAAVKSMKYYLRRITGSRSWTYEQLMTLLIEIEAILNSRPLYALSDDPNDIQALTPGHFLIGGPLKVPMTINPPEQASATMIKLWNETEEMKKHFWSRWLKEYLPTLQVRGKWRKEIKDYQVGQLVIIKDENLPPAQWLLGRIVGLITGKDGLVRSVDIKTEKSILSRPVQKICILPVAGAEMSNESESLDSIQTHISNHVVLSELNGAVYRTPSIR